MAKPRYMWLTRPTHKDGRPGDVYPSSAYRRKTRRQWRAMVRKLYVAGVVGAARALAKAARNG